MRLGLMKGSSPSICAISGYLDAIVCQASTGDLWFNRNQFKGNTNLGMMGGTSPSICKPQ